MAGGIDHAVGSAADEVAKGGQKLEEVGGRMGFGVRSHGTDGEPCLVHAGRPRAVRGSRIVGAARAMVAAPGVDWVADPVSGSGVWACGWVEIEQVASALPQVSESGKEGGRIMPLIVFRSMIRHSHGSVIASRAVMQFSPTQ